MDPVCYVIKDKEDKNHFESKKADLEIGNDKAEKLADEVKEIEVERNNKADD